MKGQTVNDARNDLVVVLTKEQIQLLLAVLDDATIKGRHAKLLCSTRDALLSARSFARLLTKPLVPPAPPAPPEPSEAMIEGSALPPVLETEKEGQTDA